MTRDEILKEFDTGVLDDTADDLADEVVRLRTKLDEAREALRVIADANVSYEAGTASFLDMAHQTVQLCRRADRAERILAALREPSEAIDAAACEALPYGISLAPGIRAAVEAAEREVDA